MKRLMLTVFSVAVLAAAGLGQTKMDGVRWELVELNGRATTGSKAFLEFDAKAKRLSGNAGCNRLFGSYQIKGKKFKTGPLGTTKMACRGDAAFNESAFLKAVGEADSYSIAGRNLVLRSGGTAVAKFKRMGAEGEGSGLEPKKWVLTAIAGEPVMLVKGAAFINFDVDEGRAGGNGGCNSFSGKFKVSGDTIKFGDLLSTMMACRLGNRMEIERQFMDGLQKADGFAISGNRLRIMKAGETLLEFEGAAK